MMHHQGLLRLVATQAVAVCGCSFRVGEADDFKAFIAGATKDTLHSHGITLRGSWTEATLFNSFPEPPKNCKFKNTIAPALNRLLPEKRLRLRIAPGNLFILACCCVLFSCRQSAPVTNRADQNKPLLKPPTAHRGKPPDTIRITAQNRPIRIRAGKPTIVKDPSGGGRPYIASLMSEDVPGLQTVLSSCFDSDGNLWLGTAGAGVCRYNGSSSVFFDFNQGLGSNVVFAIYQDQEKNMWFGTSAGLCRYDGYTLRNFTMADGLAGNMVTSIAEDSKQRLWIGTQGGGLSTYDGKTFSNLRTGDGLSDNYVRCLLPGANDTMWIGTVSGGLNLFDGKTVRTYTRRDGLPANFITTIIAGKPGVIWLGTNQGLSRFDGKAFTNYSTAEGLPETSIVSLLQDREGSIWMGSATGKLMRYDGQHFKVIYDAGKKNAAAITSLLEDKSGNIWLTGIGNGASRYPGDYLRSLSQQEGLAANIVFTIQEDKHHNICLPTYGGGLSVYDGSVFRNYTKTEGLADNLIWDIMADDAGNIWLGTDGSGLSRFDGTHFTNFTTRQGLPSNSVPHIMQDKQGRFWFGTAAGVSVFDGRSFTNYTTEQGLPGLSIMGFAEDKAGNIWIATHDDGVCKYDGKQFYWYQKSQGLISNSVYSILADRQGVIWVGTNSGLTKIDGERFTSFTTADGMADNYIWVVVEDTARNIIWAGSNKGLTAVKQNPATGSYTFENFNEKTGFPLRQASGLLVDSKGTIWFGSGHKEVIRFNYEEALSRRHAEPPLRIENVTLNQETVPWQHILAQQHTNGNKPGDGDTGVSKQNSSSPGSYKGIRISGVERFYGIPKGLRIPHHLNTVGFGFASIDPVLQNQMQYQYKLEGYSRDWSPLSQTTNAVFGNIHPGSYVFRVRAVTPWNTVAEERFSFSVLPPWWRTWWAYALAGMFVIALLYLIYRLRIAALHRKQAAQINRMVATQEEERKRLARDLHDDVGIKLSALKMFVSQMHEKASDAHDREIQTLADKSERLIGETMQDVRQILVNLSPAVLEEFGYTTAVEGLVNKINETKTLHFDLVVFGMNKRLQKDYELALYRITQELINNILKHADAKQVSVQIGRRDEKIILMVEDDGKGFDLKEKKDGYGLHNLDVRARLMNGNMTIDSRPGKGTSVLIEIPYPQNDRYGKNH